MARLAKEGADIALTYVSRSDDANKVVAAAENSALKRSQSRPTP